jgi:hypothetical protein
VHFQDARCSSVSEHQVFSYVTVVATGLEKSECDEMQKPMDVPGLEQE